MTPGEYVSRNIEARRIDRLTGKLPPLAMPENMPEPAFLRTQIEQAVSASSRLGGVRSSHRSKERVAAWNTESEFPRAEAVLRLPYINDRNISPAQLDVREFLRPEPHEEDLEAICNENPRAVVGMETLFRTNAAMSKLAVSYSMLIVDMSSSRGQKTSLFRSYRYSQPQIEAIESPQEDSLLAGADKYVSLVDSGKIGELFAPTKEEVVTFITHLVIGTSGVHHIPVPERDFQDRHY